MLIKVKNVLLCIAKMGKGKDSWRQTADIQMYNMKMPVRAVIYYF
jgi:hypothetical protein